MNAKVFTINEARDLLPSVKTVVDELRELRRDIVDTRRRIDILDTLWGDDVRSPENPDAAEYRELKGRNRSLVVRFREQSSALDALGCHVKDLDRGIVGFFHVRDGHAVFMPWGVDEPAEEAYEELAPNARIFSVDEARAALPRLRAVFEGLDRIEEAVANLQRELQMMESVYSGDPAALDSEPIEKLQSGIRELIAQGRDLESELHRMGCQLKDAHGGLVDFYHVRDRQVVFLCWNRDEPDVVAWHALDAGLAGRQHLNGDSGD